MGRDDDVERQEGGGHRQPDLQRVDPGDVREAEDDGRQDDEADVKKDRVRVMETRPLSAQKRWRLVEIIERAK